MIRGKRKVMPFSAALALCLALLGCGAGATGQGQDAPGEQPPVQEEQASILPLDEDEGRPGTPSAARPSANGRLHVEGTQLVDEQGAPVVLRGISTHGLAWFPQYVNGELFQQLADWGANAVRLALYTEEYGGFCAGGDQEQLRQLVLEGVRCAQDADMYVIIDWHTLSDNDPAAHQSEAIAFFSSISAELGNNPSVIYEICNEPNGDTSWSQVRAYAEQVIPAVRSNAPDAVCLVGTPEWCQRPNEAASDPLAIPNVMYTVHFYAATHTQGLRDRTAAAHDAGLPIFVSEFGICDASGGGALDEAEADAWMALLDRLGISRMMWNLSNKDESSAMILSTCPKSAGLDDADLSQAGRWAKRMLLGEGAPAQQLDTEEGAPAQDPSRGASSTTVADGGLVAQVDLVNSWKEGDKTVYQFSATLAYGGGGLDGWQIELPFNQDVELVACWNAVAQTDGSVLILASESYNARLDTHAEVRDIGFQLRSGAGLELVQG